MHEWVSRLLFGTEVNMKGRKSSLFVESRWDAVLVGAVIAEVSLTAYTTATWGRFSIGATLGLVGACFAIKFWNFQCPAHNFVHLPFFNSRALNRVFSMLSSITIAVPQTLFRVHHLNHHRFNNAPPLPALGKPGDFSSTYRFSSKPGREESLLAYALIGPWRNDYAFLYTGAKKHGDALSVWVELAGLAAYALALAALNWQGVVFFLLPLVYANQAATYAHNFLEHHHARPGDRRAGAVSSYGALYNRISCNNGHHQEHHFLPQTHWTRLPELRALMLPEAERRVVPHAHLFNFGWAGGATRLGGSAQPDTQRPLVGWSGTAPGSERASCDRAR